MVPTKEKLDQLEEIFSEDSTALFLHDLFTTFLKWDNHFYEQMDGVASENPVSLVIANY